MTFNAIAIIVTVRTRQAVTCPARPKGIRTPSILSENGP
jgi:hypothetical protein